MTLSTGGSRQHLRPLTHDPHAPVRGSHRGASAALNISNPIPGMHYYWERRDRNRLVMRAAQGWQVTPADSQEMMGLNSDPNIGHALDTAPLQQDVLQMRMPESKYAQYVKDKMLTRQDPLAEAKEEFIGKGERFNRTYGGQGRSVYYQSVGHGTREE